MKSRHIPPSGLQFLFKLHFDTDDEYSKEQQECSSKAGENQQQGRGRREYGIVEQPQVSARREQDQAVKVKIRPEQPLTKKLPSPSTQKDKRRLRTSAVEQIEDYQAGKHQSDSH